MPSPTPRSQGQRRAPRALVTCLVWVEGDVEPRGAESLARALDLSSLGVGLLSPRALPEGTPVKVELLVPPANLRLRTTGVVVNVQTLEQGFRLGVRFDRPPHLHDDLSPPASDAAESRPQQDHSPRATKE